MTGSIYNFQDILEVNNIPRNRSLYTCSIFALFTSISGWQAVVFSVTIKKTVVFSVTIKKTVVRTLKVTVHVFAHAVRGFKSLLMETVVFITSLNAFIREASPSKRNSILSTLSTISLKNIRNKRGPSMGQLSCVSGVGETPYRLKQLYAYTSSQVFGD